MTHAHARTSNGAWLGEGLKAVQIARTTVHSDERLGVSRAPSAPRVRRWFHQTAAQHGYATSAPRRTAPHLATESDRPVPPRFGTEAKAAKDKPHTDLVGEQEADIVGSPTLVGPYPYQELVEKIVGEAPQLTPAQAAELSLLLSVPGAFHEISIPAGSK
jgi:hypothetical protein